MYCTAFAAQDVIVASNRVVELCIIWSRGSVYSWIYEPVISLGLNTLTCMLYFQCQAVLTFNLSLILY